MRSVDQKRLLYFHEAVTAGTMRAASEKLNLAPSSISRQIALLEREVGLPLIEKGRRQILPTEAGGLLLDYFRECRAHDEVFASRLEDLHGLREGTIAIAMGEGFISHRMNTTLATFNRDYPGLKVKATIANSNEIVRQVTEDEAHFGLVVQAPHEPRLQVRWSNALEITAIVGAGHDLAGAERVSLRQLQDYPIGLVDGAFRIRQVISAAEARDEIFLSPVLTTNSLYMLRRFVTAGAGITILPQTVFSREIAAGEVHAVPLDNDALVRPTAHIITRAGRQLPAGAHRLLEMIKRSTPL
ncbi:hypothetical protein CCR85_09570 [Rhodothalassium salexigens]|uniref:LysR family transcriptional regulator n=1 Tax=Rhodothalassium salexigens TaxID=1086 RepID=UPI001914911A|nr:LysR family transcriptional regulator [Rhodothalassium salexigens]MBK5911733.1 hypothetical protein [Rhodothalassium salexigens]MBK5920479.1 hypothetical protein [Rhodothalassium salexigens]